MLLPFLLLGLLAGVQSADVCQQVADFPKGCGNPMTIFCFNQETKRCEGIKACPPLKYTNAFANKESCASLCVDGSVEDIDDEAQNGDEDLAGAEDDDDNNDEDDDVPAAAKVRELVRGRNNRRQSNYMRLLCRNVNRSKPCRGNSARCKRELKLRKDCALFHAYRGKF